MRQRPAQVDGPLPGLREWNTLLETIVEISKPGAATPAARQALAGRNAPQALADIAADSYQRTLLPLEEFNRVLGGGLVPGSLVLIGGDPGIGKSTLLLQMSAGLAANGQVLYVSRRRKRPANQAAGLAAQNAGRQPLHPHRNQHDRHFGTRRPDVAGLRDCGLDSDDVYGRTGIRARLGQPGARVRRPLSGSGEGPQYPGLLIGHVTKTGAIAGPRVLEHIVDTVLYLEGERYHAYRLLRSVKNRFGATNEVGIFEMSDEGLSEVTNPSEAFLAERLPNAAGSAIAVTLEGTRPLLVEVQALSSTTSFGNPRRTANGVDFNRLLLIVAVLTKRVGVRLSDQDVL